MCSNLVPHAEVLRLGGEAVGGALPAGPDAAAVLAFALTIAAVFQRARIPKRAVLSELYTMAKRMKIHGELSAQIFDTRNSSRLHFESLRCLNLRHTCPQKQQKNHGKSLGSFFSIAACIPPISSFTLNGFIFSRP